MNERYVEVVGDIYICRLEEESGEIYEGVFIYCLNNLSDVDDFGVMERYFFE